MPLPKSLTQPFRQGNLVVGSGFRAYFAPFNRALAVSQTSTQLGPSIYDLEVFGRMVDTSTQGAVALGQGWYDLGYIKKFKFTPQSKVGAVRSGYRGAIRAQYRGEVGEQLSFSFEEMTRMALSIASGTQVFNLLATTATFPATTSGYGPLSAAATTASSVSSYSPSGGTGADAGYPTLSVGSTAGFTIGGMVAVDVDYNGTDFGFVGSAGANVFPGAVSATNVDFIRQTTDYVATIRNISGSSLVLTKPFVGGGNGIASSGAYYAPPPGAKAQVCTGYVSREGGTYIREWSGVFILDTIDASQILLYYPRISPAQYGGLGNYTLENAGTTDLGGNELDCTLNALAYDDPLDGETVVRYMAFYPHSGEDANI